ncbi:MAG: DUF4403 family protein [Bacteroidales bacterium]|nr:DUF4403 family protein [Bacteroidales bacterium]
MKLKNLFFLIITVWFMILINGCASVKPEAPVENYLEEIKKPQLSVISLPVNLDIGELENLINSRLKGLIYEDNSLTDNGGDNLMVKAWKRDNIRLSMMGNELRWTVPLKLWLKAGFKLEKLGIALSDYREFNAEIILKFKTKLDFSSDWKIKTNTTAEAYEWISTPSMKIGMFEFPITMVADYILTSNLNVMGKELDKAAANYLDLGKYMSELWTAMENPIPIPGEQKVWIYAEPIEVMALPIEGKNGKFIMGTGIQSYLWCFVNEKPVFKTNKAIPPLKKVNAIPKESAINVSVDLPFTEIQKIATKEIVGKMFENGNRKITVQEIKLYGSKGNMIVETTVTGDIKGKLYFRGKAMYQPKKESIDITDFDFDIKTSNILHKSASWLYGSTIRNTIAKQLSFPISEQIEDMKKLVNSAANNYEIASGIRLKAELRDIIPGEITILPDKIRMQIQLSGKIELINK